MSLNWKGKRKMSCWRDCVTWRKGRLEEDKKIPIILPSDLKLRGKMVMGRLWPTSLLVCNSAMGNRQIAQVCPFIDTLIYALLKHCTQMSP